MDMTSYKVSDSLYLVQLKVEKDLPKKPVEMPVNHVVVIDCSGSMSGDLPRVREQLKKKLPKMLKEKDTISIIWFSGRGQFGTLLEAEPVATLADLKDVNGAIDRWLSPVGLTGFKEPIDEAVNLVGRVSKKNPGNTFSLFFMSDGCDNQWSRPDILKSMEKAAGSFSSSTFVEYGYYADRPLLTAMAEKAGGNLIFADDFDKYAPLFEAAMQKKLSGAPRVEVKINNDVIGAFAFAMVSGDLVTFSVDAGVAHIPADLPGVWYLSPVQVGQLAYDTVNDSSKASKQLPCIDAAYAAISLFSVRMKPEVVLPLLKATGDVQFIDQFSGCFGKQKYSEFMDATKSAAFDSHRRWVAGYDPNKVPRDDAFTALDMLFILSEDDQNRVLLEDPNFRYSRIGRARVDAASMLTDEEEEEIKKISDELQKTKDVKRLLELNKRISEITNKVQALKFEADPAPDGYSISNLTYNESRPNVSILIHKPGVVDISSRVPPELASKLPHRIPTSIFRNYTIIKDGLIGVKVLPVKLSEGTNQKLQKLVQDGLIPSNAVTLSDDGRALINLDVLPVTNRKMVKSVSAQDFFMRHYELTKTQAAQKVYNAYVKELLPSKRTEGISIKYGDEAAAWLKDQGITDGGFNPKVKLAEASDFYMGKELNVSLKGLSKLPSLKELKDQIAKNKLNPGGTLMKPFYDEVEAFLASSIYQKAAAREQVLEVWLEGQATATRKVVKGLIREIAQTTLSLIVGQVWFTEFKSLDENTLTLNVDGHNIEAKAELTEIQVKI